MSSPLEEELATQLRGAGLVFEREARFCAWRKFRADFLVRGNKYWALTGELHRAMNLVLVEVQGGQWGGRHATGVGLGQDCEKMAHMAALGWRCVPLTASMVHDGSGLRLIEAALGIRPLEPPPVKARLKRSQAARKPKRGKGLPPRVLKGLGL